MILEEHFIKGNLDRYPFSTFYFSLYIHSEKKKKKKTDIAANLLYF